MLKDFNSVIFSLVLQSRSLLLWPFFLDGKKAKRALNLFAKVMFEVGTWGIRGMITLGQCKGLPVTLVLCTIPEAFLLFFCFPPTGIKMAVRNVLVTGCSSGIGLALAVRLARDELKRFRGKANWSPERVLRSTSYSEKERKPSLTWPE